MAAKMYGKILVPVDGSETSSKGLQEAIKLAKTLGSKLCLVHVVNELIMDYSTGLAGATPFSGDVIEGLREGGKATLAKAEAVVRKSKLEPKGVLLEAIGGHSAHLTVAHALNVARTSS
jgi:nucleotide-binding universal stress UspA family protein